MNNDIKVRGKNNSKVTIKDVARKSGFTIGTVSNVLNGKDNVKEETRKKVLEAIHELGYVRNLQARNMRIKMNKIIGFLVPKFTNYFYAGILNAFMYNAEKEGYTVFLLDYDYNVDQEKKCIDILLQNQVGTLILANGSGDEEFIKKLVQQGIKIILMDRHIELDGVSCISYKNNEIIEYIIGKLKDKGYKSIGYVSEKIDIVNLKDRFEAYVEGLKKYGYEYNKDFVFISSEFTQNHIAKGYEFADNLIKTHLKEDLPQSFIVSSDLIAIGMLKAFKDNNYKIPGDFGIVGCDNIDIASYVDPPLSTIEQDRDEMGLELWNMTKQLNEGKIVKNKVLDQKLIIRESF